MKSLHVTLTMLMAASMSLGAQQLSNLPTMRINTEGGQGIYSKTIYIPCTVETTDGEEVIFYEDGNIRGRGNSTWGLAKKPYRLKFNSKKKMLGADRASAKSWVLLANHADKTLLRNAVASQVGTLLGQKFTAGVQFVDLELNNQFQGNYQLTDQIDIRKGRVKITEQDTVVPMGQGVNITGGYLLEADGFGYSEPVKFTLRKGGYVVIKSPDEDIINDEQVSYITNFVHNFEDVLYSPDFRDPDKGYRQYVDSTSLASWYLASELTANIDCFWSTYFYKEKDDDHIYFGPMWDYDIAFNNDTRKYTPGSLMRDIAYDTYDLTGAWVDRMVQDPWFNNLLDRTWRKALENDIQGQLINYVDSMAQLLDESQRLNYSIYPIDKQTYHERVLYSTYLEGIEYLKNEISDRCNLLSQSFLIQSTDPDPVDPDPVDPDEPDEPEPAAPVFTAPEHNGIYAIYNLGAAKPLAPNDRNNVVLMSTDNHLESPLHHWLIQQDEYEPDYFRIYHERSGMVVTDGDTRGSSLSLASPDDYNRSQLWKIEEINPEVNSYVIVNAESGRGWNNNGGFSTDNNPAISWDSDANNAQKATRQWQFAEVSPGSSTVLDELNVPDYAVTYCQANQQLHFTIYSATDNLTGQFSIYSLNGNLLLHGNIDHTIDLSSLSNGFYVLRWQFDGQQPKSLKFRK